MKIAIKTGLYFLVVTFFAQSSLLTAECRTITESNLSTGWDYKKGDLYVRTNKVPAEGRGLKMVSFPGICVPAISVKGTGEYSSISGKCISTQGNNNRFICFDIDPRVLGEMPPGYGKIEKDGYNVEVVVEYFDEGNDSFTMQYDAIDEDFRQVGFWPESRFCKKTNSKTWKRFVFHLLKADFKDGVNGCDFRIDDNADGYEYIASVSVLKPRLYLEPMVYTSAGYTYSSMDAQEGKGWQNLADAGLGYRLFINWKNIQPKERGHFVWTEWDRIIEETFVKRGMKLVPTLPFNTEWSSGSSNFKDGISSDSNRTDYANWMFEAVKRSGNIIKIWETWHEPMWPTMWTSASAADYARLQCAAYQKAKEADPTCCVVSGGVVSLLKTSNYKYHADSVINDFFKNGIEWGLNVFGYHPNGFEGSTPEETSLKRWEIIAAEVKKYITVPFLQSEDYILCSSDDMITRAKFSVRSMALQRAKMGTLSYSFFPSSDWLHRNENHFGLIDVPNNEKRQPLFNVAATMAARMKKSLYDTDLVAVGNTDCDYAFRFSNYPVDETGAMIAGSKPSGKVVVLWNVSGKRDVSVKGLPSGKVNICDQDGANMMTVKTENGKIIIYNLDDKPRYLWY
jgi:hypothetical protein